MQIHNRAIGDAGANLEFIEQDSGDTSKGNIRVVLASTGTLANAWDAVAAGAGDTSDSVEVANQYRITAFGSSDAATTVSVWVSQDDTTYYDSGESQVLAAAGDFHISFETAAKYVRLKTSGAATITATIVGK